METSTIDCPKRRNWFSRCQFEGRYDTFTPGGRRIEAYTAKFMEACKDKKYVRDVCVRCGRTIERV